jgi:excinuclease UvrABC helicase subunit UvrB
MSLTVSIVKKPATVAGESALADVTFDSSYTTGGLAVSPSAFGFRGAVTAIIPAGRGAGSRICEYDDAAQKLKLFTALGTEAANASNQATITFRVLALGPDA